MEAILNLNSQKGGFVKASVWRRREGEAEEWQTMTGNPDQRG